jgi:uncharacterized membrane protein YedE/YeeE
MLAQAIPFVIACLFAFLLGFAAHRASICTVRAVAEVISARTAFMLASIAKSALWVIALTLPFLWLVPAAAAGIGGWPLTLTALFGGLLFGFGAALNGGCAYSTMTRLMDGEVRMAVSIGGFAVGILTFLMLVDVKWLTRPAPTPALIGSVLTFALLLSALLLAWAIYELPRIWRNRPKHMGLKDLVLAPQYRLSTAALLIGIASAVIFLLIGSPGYTITLQTLVQGLAGSGALPNAARGVLLLAVLAGMLASTLQRGSFRLDWRPQLSWLRNIFGGALMGLGTAMLPGGNDALILYGIPSFSPHALPAYIALILGAAIGLLAMKHLGGIDARVVCSNDIYRAENQPRSSILNSHPPSSRRG